MVLGPFRIWRVRGKSAGCQAFSAVCPDLPGCASAGDTEEVKENIKEAIELYLAPSEVELSRNAKLDEVTVG
jgi:predicted RNase H-like HicB family nuclease